MKWFVERSQSDFTNSGKFAETIRKHGHTCVECVFEGYSSCVLDFHTQKPIEPTEPDRDGNFECEIAFGTINFAKWANYNVHGIPGMWLNFEQMRCSRYYVPLGPYILNSPYAMMPLGEVSRQRDWLYRTFDDGSPVRGIFIRPDDNAKSFTGSVVYDACFDRWYSEATCYDATHNTMAVVSPYRKIEYEWRLVVHNGRIITGSQYKRNGEVDIVGGYDPAVAKFVEKALYDANYNPYPIFCVDVCLTDTYNDYKIVEIGSINTCGLYDCDMDVIVDAVATEAEKEMKEW